MNISPKRSGKGMEIHSFKSFTFILPGNKTDQMEQGSNVPKTADGLKCITTFLMANNLYFNSQNGQESRSVAQTGWVIVYICIYFAYEVSTFNWL